MERVTNKEYRINFPEFRRYIRNPSLLTSSKAVLTDILLYAGVDGVCFPSHKTLAADMGLSDRQITNLVKELKVAGALSWVRGGFGKSNRYLLNEEVYFPTGDTERKQVSLKSGNTLPPQTGNTLPTKVVSESSQVMSSSHIQQIFEETSKRRLSKTESYSLVRLCEEYSEPWVMDSLKEVVRRGIPPSLSPNYLESLLKDWRAYGKPTTKPVFTPCGIGRCDGGGWFENNVRIQCECKNNYDHQLEEWKKNGRRQLSQ